MKQLLTLTEPRLLIGMLAVAAGLWGLLKLGGEVAEGETGAFDQRILQALRLPGQPHVAVGAPWIGEVMRDVSALGGTTVVTLATLFAVAALAFHQSRRRALLVAGVVVTALLCDEGLKALYGRARPEYALPGVMTYAQSFPSGHSTASAALWLTLAIVAASFEQRPTRKAFWIGAAGAVIAAVGFSRVYLGVHWPTDVLAGWILGGCFALGGWMIWRGRRSGGTPPAARSPEQGGATSP